MYSSWGNLYDAHQVFDEIPIKNVVCWTALISGYVGNKKSRQGIELFREMVKGNVVPDQVTFTVALSACADLGALDMGEWVCDCIRRQGLVLDLFLENALVNMYAKCGDIGNAKGLFDSMVKKDVTTWTSMIVGYALHGQAEEALRLYAEMTVDCRDGNRGNVGRSIVPNDVTFIGVLMACSHAGLVEEGKRHFKSMTDVYGLKVQPSHYGCMVDLLCRAGLLQEAYEFVMAMPKQPNDVVWRTLLGACSSSGNVELAAKAHHHLLTLRKGLAADDVAMSNVYAATEMWDERIIIRDQAKQRKAPGCSSVWHQ
ncbi:Pentatricopeptide repeat-containing protein [Heracleum sosnowskyi]|uniref:Pentatricopeptide repeat-containing protein n=1 Tax=Heracleum sosnowskyi TaxID=360622 RepID=A0AAD8GZR7_9APIA|nr:Pentatricopeptide repeat-containing protein [Heracleum sosnowskyi]